MSAITKLHRRHPFHEFLLKEGLQDGIEPCKQPDCHSDAEQYELCRRHVDYYVSLVQRIDHAVFRDDIPMSRLRLMDIQRTFDEHVTNLAMLWYRFSVDMSIFEQICFELYGSNLIELYRCDMCGSPASSCYGECMDRWDPFDGFYPAPRLVG